MTKAIIFSLLSFLFITQGYAAPLRNGVPVTARQPLAATFNVRIALVDIDGEPVSGTGGLRGYWARNLQTGQLYYPGGQVDEDKFFDLPAGTYEFGAYPGNWVGATTEVATLHSGLVGEDGFIVVELTYWVE